MVISSTDSRFSASLRWADAFISAGITGCCVTTTSYGTRELWNIAKVEVAGSNPVSRSTDPPRNPSGVRPKALSLVQ